MSSSLVGFTLDKYEIVDNLGQGGMATVYKGYQREVERYVAVKVLPPHPGQDTQFVERFRLEARTIARLQHPYILPLYDYGNQDDILYLVMPYVEGESLRDRISREGQLPLDDALEITSEVAAALSYAHSRGVIHRDIKPENVLLSAGEAVVADFGIARAIATSGQDRLTRSGFAVGTSTYMSPEQVMGADDIDHRSDFYSLGCVLFECLAGRPPFVAVREELVLSMHHHATPQDVRELRDETPEPLATVVTRALEKDPEDRWQSAAEMIEALEVG